MVNAPSARCQGGFEQVTGQDVLVKEAPFSACFAQGGSGLIRDKSI